MKANHYTFLRCLLGCLLLTGSHTGYSQPGASGPDKFLHFTGGSLSYLFNYRSAIDTLYIEKDIVQNSISGYLDLTIAGRLPLRITYGGRYSNSTVFKNFTDVRFSFNQQMLKNNWQQVIKKRLSLAIQAMQDSLLESAYQLKYKQYKQDLEWLNDPFTAQKLIEANEIVKVPRITYDISLPDSTNKKKADSLQAWANDFLDLYAKTKLKYDNSTEDLDSLKLVYDKNVERIGKLQSLLNKDYSNIASLNELQQDIKLLAIDKPIIPSEYKWLAGVRDLSVGRIPVNHTALTAKDISIKGVNVEYNSWYYLAVTAGVVDYQFRDFAFPPAMRAPQYMYMVRAGIGRLERNYFILSAYRGGKQLFAGAANGNGVIHILGYSAEAKYHLSKHVYVVGEIAESISPNYAINPVSKTRSFNLSDNTNKGVSVQLYSFFPKTSSRLQAMYKYTGANFQSFSSFQPNAALRSWNVQAEQYFIRRQLKITAALKQNDFTNPFLLQHNSSNTVLKSIAATLSLKKYPVVSAGYLPMSQVAILDGQVVEARFQTTNVSVYHSYKIANVPLASTVVYNRFSGAASDTGFIYSNAVNVFVSQNLSFDFFTTCLSVSHTKNSSYELNVMDQHLQFTISNAVTGGGGIKLSRMSRAGTKTGVYVHAAFRIGSNDIIYMNYEKGFIPGYAGGLVKNDMGTIQYTRNFTFR